MHMGKEKFIDLLAEFSNDGEICLIVFRHDNQEYRVKSVIKTTRCPSVWVMEQDDQRLWVELNTGAGAL
jgi:hypothetical protein